MPKAIRAHQNTRNSTHSAVIAPHTINAFRLTNSKSVTTGCRVSCISNIEFSKEYFVLTAQRSTPCLVIHSSFSAIPRLPIQQDDDI